MTRFTVRGVQVDEAGCACGAKPTAADADRSVSEWERLYDVCAFCGNPVRLLGGQLKHFHDTDLQYHYPDRHGRGNVWSLDVVRHESEFVWFGSGPWGSTDIHAHVACAKKECPHAPWREVARVSIGAAAKRLGDFIEGRVETNGSLDDIAPVVEPIACRLCSDHCGSSVPTPRDIAIVLQWVRECLAKTCAYCGSTIKIENIQVHHFKLTGEHGHWRARTWRIEPSHYWCASGEGGPADIYGHIRCARGALQHAKWQERVR